MDVRPGKRGLLPAVADGALSLDTDWQSVLNCSQFCTAYDEVGYSTWPTEGSTEILCLVQMF